MKRLKLPYIKPEIDFVYAEPDELMENILSNQGQNTTMGDGDNGDDETIWETPNGKVFDFDPADDADFNPFFMN